MKNLLYKIMISSIYTAQNNGYMSDIWKFASGFYFAFATSIYVIFVYLILNNYILDGGLDFLTITFISERAYNFVLNAGMYSITPIMLLHYFLFLRHDKFKVLIKQYKNQYNKKLFAWYFIIALIFMFVSLFLKVEKTSL
ncbi:hypothetical protein [Flavobacterium microcysteis]|uniref:Uncharacterized protein n=1 Tax=Flavobacterium microcysteis TaxID=2596891 RepID=A0A501QCT2_9FLAO|nr:hypothetical protein [Flavobacterium microcysteis]TPD69786.1 hypothetical protein FJA49_07720 [Flavobacterium microcysteis]